jgi:hypothetical protein
MEAFKIKNGLSAKRYLGSNGTETAGSTSAYDIANTSYSNISFDVSNEALGPTSFDFSSDGTKMYMLTSNNDAVYQYTLSTAFDLSTASYASKTFSVVSQDSIPTGLAFSSDGTKMYMCGINTDKCYQYTLSTAWDVSTGSYAFKSLSFGSQDSLPYNITFNDNGTKLYMIGGSNDSIFQYSLSTAYDLSTASYDSVSFSVTSQETTPRGITFNGNGTKMYIVGSDSDSIFQYSLSTSYDLSTASYDSISFNVSSQNGGPRQIKFNSDGTKHFIIADAGGAGERAVYEYSTVAYTQTLDLSTGTTFSFTPSGATTVSFTNPPASGNAIGFSVEINGDGSAITWPSSVKWDLATAPTATASKELYTFVTTDGGTTYYGKKAAEGLA